MVLSVIWPFGFGLLFGGGAGPRGGTFGSGASGVALGTGITMSGAGGGVSGWPLTSMGGGVFGNSSVMVVQPIAVAQAANTIVSRRMDTPISKVDETVSRKMAPVNGFSPQP